MGEPLIRNGGTAPRAAAPPPGTAILADRKWNTFDRLRASAAHPAELLAGKAIPILGFILLQQTVLLALGIAVGLCFSRTRGN